MNNAIATATRANVDIMGAPSKHVPAHVRDLNGGKQWVFRFPNGYGASIVTSPGAYGGLELGVLEFDGPSALDYDLTYDTPVTNDVLGYLEPAALESILDAIAALPVSIQAISA